MWGVSVRMGAQITDGPLVTVRDLCASMALSSSVRCACLLWPPFVCVGVPCADRRPHVHVFAVNNNIAHSSSSRLSRRAAHHMRF